MHILSALVVNGTYIVPAGAPKVFTTEQLDKLSIGAMTAGLFPFIAGIGALTIHSGWNRKGFSYAPLSTLWLWSVTLVGFGIFAQYGRFTHLVDFLAILHIQTEWLIIGLLLNRSAEESAGLAAAAGAILYTFMFSLPGIRGSFFTTSTIGGFGDVFIPVLLFHGKQPLLAIGGVGHFLNAFVTFQNFVQYIDVSLYLVLQFLAGAIHGVFTIAGLVRLHQAEKRIRLHENGDSEDSEAFEKLDYPLIGVYPTKKTLTILVLVALVGSLAASVPINFWPRH